MQTLRRYYYLYLFLVVVWSPLQLFVLQIDNLGRTIAVLNVFTFLTLLLNKETRKCITSRYTLPWLLWIIIETIVLFAIKGYHYDVYQKDYLYVLKNMLSSLVVMYVVMYEAKNNWKNISIFLVLCFLSYVLLSSLGGMSFSMAERQLTVMGNSLPMVMVSLVFFSFFLIVNNVKNRGLLYGIVFVALLLIFISGARKYLFAAIILLFFAYLAKLNKISFGKLIRLVFVASIALVLVNYIVENSFYADRFEESMDVGEDANYTDIKWLSYLGDRTIMYIEGFDFFKENPVLGIGLTNYFYYSSVHQMMHSEYMVQVAECGLVGVYLFVLFYSRLIKGIISKKNNITRSNRLLMMGYMIACLFMAFTSWLYSSASIYMVFGLIIAYFSKNNVRDESINC